MLTGQQIIPVSARPKRSTIPFHKREVRCSISEARDALSISDEQGVIRTNHVKHIT